MGEDEIDIPERIFSLARGAKSCPRITPFEGSTNLQSKIFNLK
jgi:hypothetical protein